MEDEPLGGHTIMVAETDAEVRDVVLEFLAEVGALATAPCNVYDMMSVLRAKRFEILLIDIKLWLACTARVAACVFSYQRGAAIVITGTALAEPTLRPEIRRLAKPYTLQALEVALTGALRRQGGGAELDGFASSLPPEECNPVDRSR